ncbi:conserved exported protein of unknown function [Rhodovastum atsumiense]|uniref:DUF2059 domain-containing protein n=1 Tax=Rhodovastum atsumiense TaxID=504468 RepID=A0A5M6J268_9PROT|nr:DUF2059 domain-containing protein [Rhodovastum atsumiense]KAA5614329.1 DUF2059 domain-containing protein [Rhodovastum atsumiense]CAH2604796.1 conserved exported protein of unknown function [Rhodovastum atsumiense]
MPHPSFLLMLALLLPVAAAAQAPAAPPAAGSTIPVTAEGLREARALGELLSIPAQAQNFVGQIRNAVVNAAIRASGKSAEDAARIVDEIILPDFRAKLPEVEAMLVENLAAHYTVDDLRGMREFFSTPLGQRWLRGMPAVGRDETQRLQQLAQKLIRESTARHADALRARGVKF